MASDSIEANTIPIDEGSSSSSTSSDNTSSSTSESKLIQAEARDLVSGNTIWVRGEEAMVTNVDFPHIFWRLKNKDGSVGNEKHRSFLATPHLFTVDPTNRPALEENDRLKHEHDDDDDDEVDEIGVFGETTVRETFVVNRNEQDDEDYVDTVQEESNHFDLK